MLTTESANKAAFKSAFLTSKTFIDNLQFQKATKQNVNMKKLKQKTRLFAQLKTLLKQRVKETTINQENINI